MKKRWWIALFALLAVGVIAVILVVSLPPRGPVYQGKPVSFWVDQMPGIQVNAVPVGKADPALTRLVLASIVARNPQAKAQRGLQGIGTNAIPYLLARLQRRSSGVGRLLFRLAKRRWLRPMALSLLPETADFKSGQAITAILSAEFPREAIVPSLVRLAQGGDRVVAARATLILEVIDPAAAAKAVIK